MSTDWHARIRQALADAPYLPDDDVIEELALHAGAAYDAARSSGGSEEDAERRVDELVQRWRRDADALRHRPKRAPHVEPPPVHLQAPFPGAGLLQDLKYAIRLLVR